MSDEVSDVDINELFEDLLLAENKAHDSGFRKGYSAGENQPVNGYHLGYHRASMLSSQLGYYRGVTEHCLNNKILYSSKIWQLAEILHEEIVKFPKINSEVLDILQMFEDIKFKFAKLCSIAKINLSYGDAEKLDF